MTRTLLVQPVRHIKEMRLGNILVIGRKYGLKIQETKRYCYLLEKDIIKQKIWNLILELFRWDVW